MEKAPKWVKWEIRYPSSLKSPFSISSTWVQLQTISQAFFDSVMSTPCIIMLSRITFCLYFSSSPFKVSSPLLVTQMYSFEENSLNCRLNICTFFYMEIIRPPLKRNCPFRPMGIRNNCAVYCYPYHPLLYSCLLRFLKLLFVS